MRKQRDFRDYVKKCYPEDIIIGGIVFTREVDEILNELLAYNGFQKRRVNRNYIEYESPAKYLLEISNRADITFIHGEKMVEILVIGM